MRPSKKDELIRKALDVFYRHGFHASGMDLVAKETGVSKTAIYNHFRTKDDLILEVIKLRDEEFRAWMVSRIEAYGETPEERLLGVFDAHAEWFAQKGFFGCLFIKACAEFQDPAHPIHQQSCAHQQQGIAYYRSLADAAGFADPDEVARNIWLLAQGSIVAAVMAAIDDPAGTAREAATKMLACAERRDV